MAEAATTFSRQRLCCEAGRYAAPSVAENSDVPLTDAWAMPPSISTSLVSGSSRICAVTTPPPMLDHEFAKVNATHAVGDTFAASASCPARG